MNYIRMKDVFDAHKEQILKHAFISNELAILYGDPNIFKIIISTNISSNRLGTTHFKFDLLVIDEAGQSDIATALIPIARATSLLLVGDPNQLEPIIV